MRCCGIGQLVNLGRAERMHDFVTTHQGYFQNTSPAC